MVTVGKSVLKTTLDLNNKLNIKKLPTTTNEQVKCQILELKKDMESGAVMEQGE